MARWDGIYEFVQVVDSGSFSAAAETMSMSNSQVSKLVARLEERIGVRLMNRTTRKFTLTDEGESYYLQCKQTIEALETAERNVASHQSEPRGKLKINITGSFQDRFIVPILCEFLQHYPKVEVDLDFSDDRVDIIGGGYDISICYGELENSNLVARKLADTYNYLVASPDYLQNSGTPKSVEELKSHNCLIGTDKVWYFSDGHETVQFKPGGNWHSDNANALLTAARSGTGVALLPFFAVLEDLQKGTLVQLIEPWNHYPQPVWIMYADRRYQSAKVRVFVDHLIEKLNSVVI